MLLIDIGDRHVAQRNLRIEEIEAGETKSSKLKAGISGKHEKSKKRQILLEAIDTAAVLKSIESIAKNHGMRPATRELDHISFEVEGKIGKVGSPLELEMEPGQDYDVAFKIRVPRDAEKGETWIYRVVQQGTPTHRRMPKAVRITKPVINSGCTLIISAA